MVLLHIIQILQKYAMIIIGLYLIMMYYVIWGYLNTYTNDDNISNFMKSVIGDFYNCSRIYAERGNHIYLTLNIEMVIK